MSKKQPLLDGGYDTAPMTSDDERDPNPNVIDITPEAYESDYHEDDDETEEAAQEKEITMLKLVMGVPYAASPSFWFLQIPAALLVGVLVAGLGLAFFGAQMRLSQWWIDGLLEGEETYGPVYSSADENGFVVLEGLRNVGRGQGTYRWLAAFATGGFLSALVLLFPCAPTIGSARTMFDEIVDLNPRTREAPFMLLHVFFALVSGMTIGPESALAILGAEVGSLIGSILRFDLRTKCLLILTGMTAGLGGFLSSPLIGSLMLVELTISARPDDIRMDAAVAALTGKRKKRKNGGDMERTDLMNQVSLTGIGCIASYAVIHKTFERVLPSIELPVFSDVAGDFDYIYILYGVPMGLICGLLGAIYFIMQGAVKGFFVRIGNGMSMCGLPKWCHVLLMPTISALIQGCIAVSYPLTLGTGTEVLAQLCILGFDKEAQAAGIQNGDYGFLDPEYLLTSAFMNLLSLATALGFGVIGGQIMPIVFSGILLGFALPHYLPFIPLYIAVPCCATGITASFLGTPFSFILMLMVLTGVSGDVGAVMFTTALVANAINGGLGVVPFIAEKRQELLRRHNGGGKEPLKTSDLDSDFDFNSEEGSEMRKEITSLLYGS